MKKVPKNSSPYYVASRQRDHSKDRRTQERVIVNEDGVPLYQHAFGSLAAQAQPNTIRDYPRIPQSREKGRSRPFSLLVRPSAEEIPAVASGPRLHRGLGANATINDATDDSTNPVDLFARQLAATNTDTDQRSRSRSAHLFHASSTDVEETAHDSITSVPYDNRILNKLLDRLSESKAEIMSAHSQISALEEQCVIKDDHIKSLRQRIVEIESAKHYAERAVHEYSLKLGHKYEKSTGESRPNTKEQKIQTKLQSHVLSTILDRSNIQINYNITDFVQEEQEDSDETLIITSNEQRDLQRDSFPPDHVVDIVVSRHKTLEQELMKEKDFLSLCKVCSHKILKNQISKQLRDDAALTNEPAEYETPRENMDQDTTTHRVRTLDEQIDDNMRLSELLDNEFYSDIESIKAETISNLSAEYLLQMAVLLPNTHNLLINGLEKICQYRSSIYAVNFTNPYIRITLQGNLNNVHDAQVPAAFSSHAERLQNNLILTMQNELLLRQRLKFNTLINQKIPEVLFSQNTKNTNMMRVEATKEYYLKYFRDNREYREITAADLLCEANRGLTSQYYNNHLEKQDSDKDVLHPVISKQSVITGNSSARNFSAVYIGPSSGVQSAPSDTESVHTQLKINLQNSIYDISNTITSTSEHSTTFDGAVNLPTISFNDLPTDMLRDDTSSITNLQISLTSPPGPSLLTDKFRNRTIDSTNQGTSPEIELLPYARAQQSQVQSRLRIIPPTAPKAKIVGLESLEESTSNAPSKDSFTERSHNSQIHGKERSQTTSAKAPIQSTSAIVLDDDSSRQRLAAPVQHLPDISYAHMSSDPALEKDSNYLMVRSRSSLGTGAMRPVFESSPLQQYRDRVPDILEVAPDISDLSTISDIANSN